jgi:hypothetical protein
VTYDDERVQPQIKWYSEKAATMRDRIKLVNRVQVVVGLLGAALAAVAGATELESIALWVPVVTTIAAAITAHAAAERYEFLRVEYRRTAGQLRHLSATARRDTDFVKRCEDVISSQNEGWMAKLGEGEEAN